MIRQPAKLRKGLWIGISLFVLSCIVCFSFYHGGIAADNFNYGLEQIHAYDPAAFAGNISVIDSGASPRRFSNQCTAWLMSCFDGDWFEAAVVIIRSNYLLYAAAIAFLVHSFLPRHRLTMTVVLTGCIMAGSLPSLSFALNGADDTFLGTGIPLAMIGITFALKKEKNWDAAWLFAALAALMHIHEGIWGGFMIGVIWLATSLADRTIHWKALRVMLVYAAVLLLITVPSLLQDEAVDAAAFQQIYVFWRTPHHFLLSAWGAGNIAQSGFFTLLPFAVGIVQSFPRRKEAQQRRKIFLYAAMILLWWGILGMEFLCTEVIPSSLLITLYIPKCIKFIVFVAYVAYLDLAWEACARHNDLQAFLVAAALVLPRAGAVAAWVLYLVCRLGRVEERVALFRKKQSVTEYTLLALLLVLAAVFLPLTLPVRILCGIVYLAELLALCPAVRIRQTAAAAAAAGAVLVLCVSLKDTVWRFGTRGVEWISGEASMRASVGEEIYDLAMDFRAKTDPGAQFLADPYSSVANAVQIISRRNCYSLYKDIPSAKGDVLVWHDRILRTENVAACSDRELADLMEELGLEYVLVSGDQLAAVQQSDLFAAVTQTETAGIYRAVQP